VRRYKLDRRGRPAYLARFSDGPRRVPEARGPAKVRADRLGIGTADAARKLLRSKPSDNLLREVGNTKPKELLWPVVRGNFGRGFGMTRRLRPNLPHNGVDIGAPAGTVVRAAADGLVVYSDNGLKGYGNCVMILHPGGLVTLYAHNQQTTVQAGRMVKRGERIAFVGQTGYAWGPHLHFELRDNGRLRDPMRRMVGQRSDEVNGQVAINSEQDRPIELQEQSRFAAARRGLAPR
jgi:murein DD-endopeptidase MepM/ murein hydrolase activator NlpD